MNHGYYSVFNNTQPFVLGHQKFVIDESLAFQGWSLSMTNFLSNFGLELYICCIHPIHKS